MFKILLIIFLSISFNLLSHQPKLNDGDFEMTKEDPYIIKKPEISKAIYSTLSGDEHFYKIESKKSFKMYAGITVAKTDECPNTFDKFSFAILNSNFEEIVNFNGETFEWWSWYEEYGKKWYWVGPEFGSEFQSTTTFDRGTYYIKVYNNNNLGNYVLAAGDIEKFNPLVIGKMLIVLPKINKKFWNKNNCP
tara:strand:- start:999 stop:1574 length:576 start_codon:yes stop_codon:yes gene_type:complete